MKKILAGLSIAGLVFFGFAQISLAQWRFYNSNVTHKSQQTRWLCGPTTASMWIRAITGKDLHPENDIYNGGGRWWISWNWYNKATNVPEFMEYMWKWTPANPPHLFSNTRYNDPEAAVKGIMWTIARYGQPVAVAGGGGNHYLLVRGGTSKANPYYQYGSNNPIYGVFVNDATEGSPHYSNPVSNMYHYREYNPSTLMQYWTRIGGDNRYYSIERYGQQGKTYNDNNNFSSF